jgi:hypothetical protein
MDWSMKSSGQQAFSGARSSCLSRAFLACICFAWLASAAALAQDDPARISNSAVPAQGAVSFSESGTTQPATTAHRTYFFPENECSADFWDPYAEDDAALVSQSPNRVQHDLGATIDPADTIQELPDEIVEPAQRVQQLNDEVIHPAEPIGGNAPARSIVDSPGDHPDNP